MINDSPPNIPSLQLRWSDSSHLTIQIYHLPHTPTVAAHHRAVVMVILGSIKPCIIIDWITLLFLPIYLELYPKSREKSLFW